MNHNKFKPFLLILFCLFLFSNVQAQVKKLTNQEIISMTNAGLGEDIIIQKIRTSQSDFDLSTDSLIELKQSAISNKVVEEMLKAKMGISVDEDKKISNQTNSLPTQSYGIYLYEESGDKRNLIQLMPNISVQNRVGGKITAALVPLGFGKVKTKANLAGKNADLQISFPVPYSIFNLMHKVAG